MVTVADLLAERDLELAGVHLPEPAQEVRWVATSELLDPTPFLEGGEVLLTTGLDAAGWRSQWGPYVDRLRAARVVALGFGTGLTHRTVPVGLRRACERAGLNLVEVPRRTSFVAVSQATARLIDAELEVTARRTMDAQRQLTQAALRPDARERLLAVLGSAVDGAAALIGRDETVVAAPSGPRAEEMDLDRVAEEIARIAPLGLRASSTTQAGGATLVVQPVGLRGRPSGYLAVQVPGRADESRRAAIGTAVSLLGLAAESDRQQREATRGLRSRALELLVRGDARTARIVLEAARDGSALPDRLVVLRGRGRIEELTELLAVLEQSIPVVGTVGDEVLAVAPPRAAEGYAAALAGLGLRVGVSDPVPADRAAGGYDDAGRALGVATVESPVVWWGRLLGEGAVGALDPDRATGFARAFLAGLDVEDRELLRSFLHHHGSRLKVAAELGLHRNTVRSRLARIEAVLGRSLEDPHVRVDAWIALQVSGDEPPTLGGVDGS
ncbi:MAG TPA: PucR family transcriptional regulator [Nocardioidaceae bacterium]|nr:PucR family transcriptional regulator [Nocardioidaceae bacterium]